MEKDFFRYCLKKFLKCSSSICVLFLSEVIVAEVEVIIIKRVVVVGRAVVEGAGPLADEASLRSFFLFFFSVLLIPFATFRHLTTAFLPSQDWRETSQNTHVSWNNT
jgi:hypothetical protein